MMKIKILVAAMLALNVIGCSPVPSTLPVRGPDGHTGWYAVSCRYFGMASCEEEAGEVCPYGYSVSQESETYGHRFYGHELIQCHEKQ